MKDINFSDLSDEDKALFQTPPEEYSYEPPNLTPDQQLHDDIAANFTYIAIEAILKTHREYTSDNISRVIYSDTEQLLNGTLDREYFSNIATTAKVEITIYDGKFTPEEPERTTDGKGQTIIFIRRTWPEVVSREIVTLNDLLTEADIDAAILDNADYLFTVDNVYRADIAAPIIRTIRGRQFMADSFKLPTSPASNRIMEALQAGKDKATTVKRKEEITHRQETLTITDRGIERNFTFISKRKNDIDFTAITLANIDLAIANSLPAQRLFVRTMIAINDQALDSKGNLIRDYVAFPTSDFWGPGKPYKTANIAAMTMRKAAKVLWGIGVEGKYKYSSKNSVRWIGIRPFTKYSVDEDIIYIDLYNNSDNPIDWAFLAKFITILPKYYFNLPNRASSLLLYLFVLARKRTNSIKSTGKFTISLRATQARLDLPSDDKATKQPARDIKQPIQTAVEQIQAAHQAAYGDAAFTITLHADNTLPIRSYLDTGYIEMETRGELKDYFSRRAEIAGRKIEEAKARQERIEEAAAAKKLAAKKD